MAEATQPQFEYATREEIPEQWREAYTEVDGVWRFNKLTDFFSLNTVVKKERQLRAEAEKKAKETAEKIPDDFSPEEWQTYQEWKTAEEERKLTEGEEETEGEGKKDNKRELQEEEIKREVKERYARAEKKLEERLKALEAAHTKVVKGWEQKCQDLYGEVRLLLIDNGLSDALIKVKIADEYFDAAKALHQSRVKMIEDEPGKHRAVIETDLGEVPIKDYIAEWAQTPQGKAFVLAERNHGGGLNGDGMNAGRGGKNPFLKEQWNLTEQAKLKRTDPKEYERLKTATRH